MSILIAPYRFPVAAGGAPTFRAVGAINSIATGTTTDHTVAIPAGAQIGDRAFLILFVHTSSDMADFAVDPTNWDLVGTNALIRVWSKTLVSGEPGNNVILDNTGTRANRTSAMVAVYTAAATVDTVTSHTPTITTDTHPLPTVTTTGTNKRIIYMVGADGVGSTDITLDTATGETGGDWIIDGQGHVNSSLIGVVSDDKTTAGTISNTGVADYSGSLTDARALYCIIY